eukprot:g14077.t1
MSWVRSRIADLEASCGTSAGRATASSSCSSPAASARSTIPAVYHRERLHVQPSIETAPSLSGTSSADEDEAQTAPDFLDADGRQRSASPSSSAADVKPASFTANTNQRREQDDPITSLAGGYYAKPRNHHHERAVALASEAEAGRRRSADAAAVLHQQQAENKRMARKITQLEATLAASEGRIAHLISSSARAAENASRLRRETEAASVMKEDYARRARRLEDTLAQAEKRASWLQGELEVVWACGTQRVAELEYDLEIAQRQQLATGGDESLSPEAGSAGNESTTDQGMTDTSGGSSSSDGSSRGGSRREVVLAHRDGLDKMMSDTQRALSSLRTKFYRAMGEKEKLQARCAHLESKLRLQDANGPSTANAPASTNSSNGINADGANPNTYTGEDISIERNNALRGHQHTRSETSEGAKPSGDGNRASEMDKTNRAEGGAGRSRSSRSSSRSSSTTITSSSTVNNSSTSGSTVNSSTTSSNATVAVKAAPVTTVGGKFYSWRWSPTARTGPRLSARDDE